MIFIKKVIMLFSMFLLVLCLIACNQKGEVNGIAINIGESSKFNEKEIKQAINVVKENFDYKGCKLKKIWYDEEKANYATSGYLGTGRGSINGVKPENVIILFTEFDVDSRGGDGSFNPNTTYSDWQFILIRDNKTDDWKIDDWGY